MHCVFLENSRTMLLMLKQKNQVKELLLFKFFQWFGAIT